MDLAVAGLLLWGAVVGYQMGLRRALCRLGGLLGASLAAVLGRAELKCFGDRYGALERTLESAVYNRLALPVSSIGGRAPYLQEELPAVLQEILQRGAVAAAGGSLENSTAMLVGVLAYTATFLAGLLLWWGFFHLCGAALSGDDPLHPGKGSRWGGAFIGLLRQLCCAALVIGAAVPLAWLSRVPPELLRLEDTLLGLGAWHLFASLGIWH